MKIRNVTRGESYDFTGPYGDTAIWWWFQLGKDWRAVCAACRWWAEVRGAFPDESSGNNCHYRE